MEIEGRGLDGTLFEVSGIEGTRFEGEWFEGFVCEGISLEGTWMDGMELKGTLSESIVGDRGVTNLFNFNTFYYTNINDIFLLINCTFIISSIHNSYSVKVFIWLC